MFAYLQINDRYEFPLQLDLDKENGKYLSPEADRSVRNLYTLHRYPVIPMLYIMDLIEVLLMLVSVDCSLIFLILIVLSLLG